MCRVKKVQNHNTVITIHSEDNQEYLMMGKEIGFGKKITERVEAEPGTSIYSLHKSTDRGNASELVKSISLVCLEITGQILAIAEKI